MTKTQGPGLSLAEVAPGNAGQYKLVVTGPGGSVTGSVVQLTVATAPRIYQTLLAPDGGVTLQGVSRPNSINVVFATASLAPPVIWQTQTARARP